MEHRLGRTLRVFLVVLAAAGMYRLAVVPWVEPRIRDALPVAELSPEQAAAIRARADRRLAALGDVFPPGSWEREDPIMLESRQMRLLFKQYHTLPDGRVNLVPCTLVVLPDRNRVDGGHAAQSRTIVLRAPQGAVLEFDEPIDLRQGRLAKLVGGSLRGQVTIRGTPSSPTAEDDIEIVTRDVELAELEVRTNEAVQFRYGRSTGSGRAMIAALLPRAGTSEHGPNIGGVDTIRLDRDVQMRLEGFSAGLIPGQESEQAAAAAEPQASPPVLVSCAGPLCVNVAASVITLEDRVEVVRELPGGGRDDLACDLLAIVLGKDGQGGGRMRGSVEPVEVQARGRPVVARSTGSALEARGARLGYEIATRRIVLDGEEPVSLVARGIQMEAKSIDYSPGPPGDPGSLMAVGPGWLRTQTDGSPPGEARWAKWLRMRPDESGHVASLAGDAEVAIESQGRLHAAEMHLWLDVAARGAAPSRPRNALGVDLAGIRPSRMLARGGVEIDSEQIAARTERMELWFKQAAAPPPAASAAGGGAPSSPAPASAAAPPAAPAATEPAERMRGRLVATGGLVRGLITLSPRGNDVDEMSMEGDVRIVEEDRAVAPGAPAEAGIEIRGEQVQLSRATRFDARAVVSGRPARITGRGVDLEGPLVEFDRGRNRMTVDGAGRLRMPLSGGMNGLEALAVSTTAGAAAPAQPGSLDVSWQGRMDFDGLTARFVDRVATRSGATSLTAGSLDVILAQPIQFGGQSQPRPGQRAEVARIACGSGVRIDSQSVAEDGSKSTEQLFIRDLLLDRATGGFTGSGPGRLTSTRFGQAPAMAMPAAGGPAAAAPVAAARPDELTYLGVDFQRGMRGNINQRVMEFHQRVEAIWGPIAKWGDALDAHAPGGLPPRAVTISSDVLTVGQSPPAPGQRRTSIELAAAGNILVEGESFTARSTRLAWSEAKDLLVFEGDGRSDAQLFRQVKAGAPTSTASAGKILYWRGLNRVDVEDARYLDFDQISGGGSAPKLPGLGTAPQQMIQRPVPGT
jgi:hypothetical protein